MIVAAVRSGSTWEFRVRDDGPGIEPAEHGRIFEQFQTVSRNPRPGHGMGLAITRKLVGVGTTPPPRDPGLPFPQGRDEPPVQILGPAAFALAGALLAGCTTVVVPPQSGERPQQVFILDHGRHTSLVLPHPEGLVRYAYGDWDWYAEVKTGPLEASHAVLWPSRAALGRRVMSGPATVANVRLRVGVGIERLHVVTVDADAAAATRAALDRLFDENVASAKENAAYNLTFVHHPEPYSAWNNSNHQVARWLRQMGCTVRGSAFWARWDVSQGGHRRREAALP